MQSEAPDTISSQPTTNDICRCRSVEQGRRNPRTRWPTSLRSLQDSRPRHGHGVDYCVYYNAGWRVLGGPDAAMRSKDGNNSLGILSRTNLQGSPTIHVVAAYRLVIECFMLVPGPVLFPRLPMNIESCAPKRARSSAAAYTGECRHWRGCIISILPYLDRYPVRKHTYLSKYRTHSPAHLDEAEGSCMYSSFVKGNTLVNHSEMDDDSLYTCC